MPSKTLSQKVLSEKVFSNFFSKTRLLSKTRFLSRKSAVGYTAIALGMGLAGQVNAQDLPGIMQGFHPYAGASVGLYKSGAGDYDEDNELWEIYGGIAFNQYVGVEASYVSLGELSNEFVAYETDGWGLAVAGQLPITDSFSLYAKLGQFFGETDVEFNPEFTDPNLDTLDDSFENEEPFFTVGAGLSIIDPLTVTLEYSRYGVDTDFDELEQFDEIADDSDSSDLDTAKLGLRYAF